MRDEIKRERRESTSERSTERRSEGGLNASNGSSGSGSGSGSLPSPDAVKMPKNVEEAEQMVELGEKMISFALEAAASISQPEREALKAVFSTIVIKMKVFKAFYQCFISKCAFYVS